MKQQLFQLLSIIALWTFFIPFILVLIKRLWLEVPFLLFGIYWMLNGVVNIIDTMPVFSKPSLEMLKLVYNTIDIPLVLLFIFFSTASASLKRFISYAVPAFLLLELGNCWVQGWTLEAVKYVMGLGLLLVFVAVIWVISLYMQKLEHSVQENALLFFHVSLFFAYGTFIIIYIFYYFIKVSGSMIDNYLIYYFSTLIAVAISTFGYYLKTSARSQVNQ